MFHRILLLPVLLSLVFSELFFSEYAEGSSNNKYLEIFNSGDSTVDLSGYAYPSAANAVDVVGQYEYWNDFPVGASIAAGDVYVICHGSADALIQAECDHNHTYLSNGNDGYCIVSGTESSYTILDCVGDWNGDPGIGWDVAGVANGTVDHTLARKIGITQGNAGNWSLSAGTNSDDSEWVVLDNEVWTFLGSHPHEDFSGGTATGGGTTGGDGGDTTEDCSNGIDDDGDSFIDCDDFDCNCGSEICDNGIDDDGDSFIDCDDSDLVLDFDPVELKLAGPNPFNPTTSLNVVVAEAGHVSVNVYNVVGQKVATLLNDYLNINTSGYTVNWDASNLSSGVYLVRAETANSISTQKLMLLK